MRYQFLDGLRGLAILGVVSTHIGQVVGGLPEMLQSTLIWGIRGVHLFFMVSSLTLLTVTNPNKFQMWPFFIRRFFRIAPMFYLAAVFYVGMYYYEWISPKNGMPSWFDVMLTFSFLHGLNPYGINNVVPGGWSIANEAIFYALFPLVLKFSISLRFTVVQLIFCVVFSIVNLVIAKYYRSELFDGNILDFLHFNFLANCLPFAFGALIFCLVKNFELKSMTKRTVILVQVFLFLQILLLGGFLKGGMVDELIYSFLLAGFVFFAAIHPWPLLMYRPTVILGELSFGIYLVHFAVIHLLEKHYVSSGNAYFDLGFYFFSTVGLSSVIAYAFHKLVELPCVNFGRNITKTTL